MSNEFEKKVENVKNKMKKIKNRIAVISGKGGVGKTTVAVNLAVQLAKDGKKVGLFDADVTCPNAHLFFGINHKGLDIVEKCGVKVFSLAYMYESDSTPVIWRGPMLSNILLDMLEKIDWGKIDYLIFDLPPGTSDIPITIMQMFDITGVIVVTTPQKASIVDAEKSINLAQKLGAPILGIVENMAGNIFGTGAGEKLAKRYSTRLLASIDLDKEIRESADKGEPIALKDGRFKII